MDKALLEVDINSREDTLLQNNPERTTGDVVIIGEDVISRTPEELYSEGLTAELRQLDGNLSFRVKNELLAQIFRSLGENQSIGDGTFQTNIGAVARIIAKEVRAEKDRHFQMAFQIENNYIPLAATRTEKKFNVAHYYTQADLDNLEARSAIHTEISDRLTALEATGDEGIYDFSEQYVQRMSIEARDAALAIVKQQKEELEERNRQNEARIDELQDTISILGTQLEMVREQAVVREAPLPDQAATLELLSREATKLAA